jgi:hypothetical protein
MYDIAKATNAVYDFDYGLYSVDCGTKFKWVLNVGGGYLDADETALVQNYNGLCLLNFGSWDDSDGMVDVLLGIPFLRQVCTFYDVGNAQIGFSNIK